MPAAPDMDAIPALGDMHSLEYGVFQGIAQKSIIRRAGDGYALYPEVLGLTHNDGMRSAHVLFAQGVEDMTSVDEPFPGNGSPFDAVPLQESLHPAPVSGIVGIGRVAAAVVHGQVVLRDEGGIGFGIVDAEQNRAPVQVQVHPVPEVQGPAQERPFRYADSSSARKGATVNGRLHGSGAFRHAVAHGAEIQDVEYLRFLGHGSAGGKGQQGPDP